METTTDFDEFLTAVELEDFNEVYSLYKSTELEDDWGGFSTTSRDTSKGTQYFVKCDYADITLILASDKARTFFLSTVEKRYARDMDIESYYNSMHAASKDD